MIQFDLMTLQDIHYQKYLTALKKSPFLKDSNMESLEELLSQMVMEQWKT